MLKILSGTPILPIMLAFSASVPLKFQIQISGSDNGRLSNLAQTLSEKAHYHIFLNPFERLEALKKKSDALP